MEKMKVLDLFSGIGGFALGLERTSGFETVKFCEIDPNCHKVLKKNWPHIPIHCDVSTLDGKSLRGQVQVITGGFPCQDISTAGQQRGMIDAKKYQAAIAEGKTHEESERLARTRSGLWAEYKRLIKEIKPEYVIIENVGNLRSNGLITVLKDLRELGMDAEWFIISAKSIGAWHERKRLWIIAVPYGHNFRFGNPTSTKEEKQKWWTEVSTRFRDWWEALPIVCRTANGLPRELDKGRRIRIKQLGNAVVPHIPELIGRQIMEYERKRK